MTTWTNIASATANWSQLSSSGSWTTLASEIGNFIALENDAYLLMMENGTDALLWGDVWTQV